MLTWPPSSRTYSNSTRPSFISALAKLLLSSFWTVMHSKPPAPRGFFSISWMHAKQKCCLFLAPERGDLRRAASRIEESSIGACEIHEDRGARESADAGRQVAREPTRHQRRHMRTPSVTGHVFTEASRCRIWSCACTSASVVSDPTYKRWPLPSMDCEWKRSSPRGKRFMRGLPRFTNDQEVNRLSLLPEVKPHQQK